MAKQIINVGTSANDGTGDKNRVAFQKCNSNFDELYDGQDPANLISTDPDNAIELGTDGKLWSGSGVKQYKFLLSQSGGDDPQTATSGSLTQGVTYEIVAFETGDDFTLSGAPNNTVGTKWIANGVAPTWSNGSEIGWNNGAPIVIEFTNTIGHVWWERRDTGTYDLKSSDGLFVIDKIFCLPANFQKDYTTQFQILLEDNAPDYISFFSQGNVLVSPEPQDGIFTKTPYLIEIFN